MTSQELKDWAEQNQGKNGVAVKITDEIIAEAQKFVDSRIFAGRREGYNGERNEKIIGRIGEIIVSKVIGIPVKDTGTFDDGIDFESGICKIDVKTKIRRYQIQPWYGWNIPLSQFDGTQYKNTHYLFVSYNDLSRWAFIQGWIDKDTARKRLVFFPKGAYRVRADGEKFMKEGYPVDTYEIFHCACGHVKLAEDLKFWIETAGVDIF